MTLSILEQLKEMTVVVADTAEWLEISNWKLTDVTTNPALITVAVNMPEYQEAIDETLYITKAKLGSGAKNKDIISLALDVLPVWFGVRILPMISGQISTQVDPRLSYDLLGTVKKARYVIGEYESHGYERDRILIKIAATWEGIRAAEILEREGIHCNLTLLFGLHQAIASAQANVTMVAAYVGRIMDWYKRMTGLDYLPNQDPGVMSVTRIYNYYRKFGYQTRVMGASFRNIGEIMELAGCDLLTISGKLIEELQSTTLELSPKLTPSNAVDFPVDDVLMDLATFNKMQSNDQMSNELLSEGIKGFTQALLIQEKILRERLADLEKKITISRVSNKMFKTYDLDKDGVINSEEWMGSEEVFNALDDNKDGKITPTEMEQGLGGAFDLKAD